MTGRKAPQLGFGVAGLGVAARLMMPYLLSHERVRVVAAADTRPQARDAFTRALGARVYSSVEQLCADKSVDAVYIASPTRLHAAHVLAAARAGKHVIVEKPLSMSGTDLADCVAAVRDHGIVLVCGHTHAFDPGIRTMAELVRTGELGEVRFLQLANYTDYVYRSRAAEELAAGQAGGVVTLQAPHQVDMARELADADVVSLLARTHTCDPERTDEGAYQALLLFSGGITAMLTYSGFGYFDSAELNDWRGERGEPRSPEANLRTWRRHLQLGSTNTADSVAKIARERAGEPAEQQVRAGRMFGGEGRTDLLSSSEPGAAFGSIMVSCTCGDITQRGESLVIRNRDGAHTVSLQGARRAEHSVIDELCASVDSGIAPRHDVVWAARTAEVCIALRNSSQVGRQITLSECG